MSQEVRRRLAQAWRRGLAWSALGASALLPRAIADPPPPAPHIEMWHGVQRVDVPPPPPEKETKPTPVSAAPLPVCPPPALLPAALTTLPSTPAPEPPAPSILSNFGLPAEPRVDSQLRHAVVSPEPAKETPTPPVRPAVARETVTSPPSVEAPPAPSPAPPVPVRTEPASVWSEARLPLYCLGIALLLTPFVFAAVLLAFLRRLGGGGALLRIEYINNQPPGNYPNIVLGTLPAGVVLPAAASPAPAPPASVAPAESELEPTGQPFDLGPTYEEELQLRQEQAQQQDGAVLRQLFEDNLKLREELKQAEAVPA